MLDFTVLKDYKKPVAILCKKQTEAEELLAEMILQFPKLTGPWKNSNSHWNYYEEYTCYAPHIYDKKGRCLEYSPMSYWEGAGYEIVPFRALVRAVDFGEFEVCGADELATLGIL